MLATTTITPKLTHAYYDLSLLCGWFMVKGPDGFDVDLLDYHNLPQGFEKVSVEDWNLVIHDEDLVFYEKRRQLRRKF